MKFYYTTTVEEGAVQARPDLSLGGFRSGNSVPNASLRNLFSDLSLYSIKMNRAEYIGLILKNETATNFDVYVWFEYPENCQVEYEVAVVDLDSIGQMEHINTPYQAPYFAEFHKADGEVGKVYIGPINANESIGVWFKRNLRLDSILEQYSSVSLVTNGNVMVGDEDVKVVLDCAII